MEGTQAVTLTFINGFTDRSVRTWWVNQSCDEIDYGEVLPQSSRLQGSFLLHPWRVRDAQTGELLLDYPGAVDPNGETIVVP